MSRGKHERTGPRHAKGRNRAEREAAPVAPQESPAAPPDQVVVQQTPEPVEEAAIEAVDETRPAAGEEPGSTVRSRSRAKKDRVPRRSHSAGGGFFAFVRAGLLGVVAIAVAAAAVYGLVLGVNAFARWNERRLAGQVMSATVRGKDNLLVIGVRDGQAIGFIALKADRGSKRALGIAIPDGAFVEVPGQGFERLGDSYVQGPAVSKDAVSNYLMVPFTRYVVVSGDAYQALLTKQDVKGLMGQVEATDLSSTARSDLAAYLGSVAQKDVWIVPLPVKPISVGDQSYYEPERVQVADLLLQWWGVKLDQRKAAVRIIVYNGAGTPGVAGVAAQELIRKGFQVVDSGNADNFSHKQTLVLLYHGKAADAQAVRDALGVGKILAQSQPQQVADIIVVIGSDYHPPAGSKESSSTP